MRWRELALFLLLMTLILVVFLRPLPVRLLHDLPRAATQGDGPQYIWNIRWLEQASTRQVSPFVTDTLFYPQQTSVVMHAMNWLNSTVTARLSGPGSFVLTFNLVYLTTFLLSALGMYLLIRRLGLHPLSALLSAVAYAFCPYVLAHGLGHFNLTNIYPLPWLIYFLLGWVEGLHRDRQPDRSPYHITLWPSLLGIAGTLLAAFYSEFNYFFFALIILIVFLAAYGLPGQLETRTLELPRKRTFSIRILLCLLFFFLVIASLVALTGGGAWRLAGVKIAVRSLANPLQMAWLCAALLMIQLWRRTRGLVWQSRPPFLTMGPGELGSAALTGILFLLLAWPLLQQLILTVLNREYIAPSTVWKSEFSGADLLAYLAPSPFHPVWGKVGTAIRSEWTMGLSESVLFPGLCVLFLAVRGLAQVKAPFRGLLTGLLCIAGPLSLGQHLHLGGHNLWLPLPFQLLKTLPFFENFRMATRFGLLVILSLTILAAYGLEKLRLQKGWKWAAGALLLTLFELFPAPLPTSDSTPPAVFGYLARQKGSGTLLEIPFGRLDGLKGVGLPGPQGMAWQYLHGYPLIGGYLSRIPQSYLDEVEQDAVLSAVVKRQAGQAHPKIGPEQLSRFRAKFQPAWVLVFPGYQTRMHEFLIGELKLEPVTALDGYTLYRWASSPERSEPVAP